MPYIYENIRIIKYLRWEKYLLRLTLIQFEAGKHPQPLSKSNFVDKSAGPKANFFPPLFLLLTTRSWKVLSFSSKKKSKVEFVTTLKRTLSWKMWNWTLKNVLGILFPGYYICQTSSFLYKGFDEYWVNGGLPLLTSRSLARFRDSSFQKEYEFGKISLRE